MDIRPVQASEIPALAQLWYDAWQDAHAAILPAELRRWRTLESFAERLQAALPLIRAIGPSGAPLGFCIVKEDELYQLFLAAEARGTGTAAALMIDAEERLRQNGTTMAWLACAIGNMRAARFYEKCGWHLARIMVSELETPEGIFPLEVWRYEKSLVSPSSQAM
ncbi:MAG: GNAT family N-acetyltransferase [Ferrovibrio sp.]